MLYPLDSVKTPPLPNNKYRCILADPPWHFKVWSDRGAGRSASKHYPCMSLNAIQALPVRDIVDTDCVLFLWATYPMLQYALSVIPAWGFTYKTVAFTWIKLTRSNTPATGLGYWTRSNAEICLLGTRGHPQRRAKNVHQVILSQRRKHSQKPDEQYARIVQLVPGPYIELFASVQQPGWDAWGNDVQTAFQFKKNTYGQQT